MKKIFGIIVIMLLVMAASAQPWRPNSATTNREPELINWITSIFSGPTNGITATAASNIVAQNAIAIQSGAGTNTFLYNPTIGGVLTLPGSFESISSQQGTNVVVVSGTGKIQLSASDGVELTQGGIYGNGSGLTNLPLAAIGNITNTPTSGQTNALEVTGNKYRWVTVISGNNTSPLQFGNTNTGSPGQVFTNGNSVLISTNVSTFSYTNIIAQVAGVTWSNNFGDDAAQDTGSGTNKLTFTIPVSGQYRVKISGFTLRDGGGSVDSTSAGYVMYQAPGGSWITTVGVDTIQNSTDAVYDAYSFPAIDGIAGQQIILSNYYVNGFTSGVDARATNHITAAIYGPTNLVALGGGGVSGGGSVSNNAALSDGFLVGGAGNGLITNVAVGSGLSLSGGILSASGGAGSQTPWTSDINAAGFSLSNANFLSLTGTTAQLRANLKRGGNAAAHTFTPLLFDYGGPSNRYWSMVVASYTNSFSPSAGSFDHTMGYGFNMAGDSTRYDTNDIMLGYGFENDYWTSQGIRQAEHYLQWAVPSAPSGSYPSRPWGWSLIYNGTNIPYILHTMQVNKFEMNSSNGLQAISIAYQGTKGLLMNVGSESQLAFNANSNSSGQYILGIANTPVYASGQYGMQSLGSVVSAASNMVQIGYNVGLSGYSPGIVFGETNAFAGLRWSKDQTAMQYSANPVGAALSVLSWRRFNDFSQDIIETNFAITLNSSNFGTTNDCVEIGYYTNAVAGGAHFAEVNAYSGNANETTVKWIVPMSYDDRAAGNWKEVLPSQRSKRANVVPEIALDVKGGGNNAVYYRFRQMATNASSFAYGVTMRIYSVNQNLGSVPSNFGRFYRTTGTTNDIYVPALHGQTAMTRVGQRIGILTNAPQFTLDVVGNARISGGLMLPTNALSAWPATPSVAGDAYWGNSNGVVYLLTSVPGSLTWAATNKIAP